jgi:CDP-glycerol glycerophosphotransferase
MSPLLSVVVPMYRVESYVDTCLRSVVHPRVEIIAVDDASPDRSASIAATFPTVRTVRLPSHVGLGAARTAGLSLCTARHVWFVDGDDVLPHGAVDRVLSGLAADPDVLLIGHALLSGAFVYADPSSVSCGASPIRVRQAAWNRIVRVDLLRRTGVGFPDGLYEDVPYSHLVVAAATRVASVPAVCYLYRSRSQSLTRRVSPQHFDVFDQYERLFETLSDWRVSPRLHAWLHLVMVRHYQTILGAPDRVPPCLRRAFFARMVEHDRRYRPAVGPPLPASLVPMRLGSYEAYLLGHLAKRVWSGRWGGKDHRMTEHPSPSAPVFSSAPPPPDVVDDGVTDVLADDEVVHVSPSAAELAETLEHEHASTFVAEVPDWDDVDPLPST